VSTQVLSIDLRAATPDAPPVAMRGEEHSLGVIEEGIPQAHALLQIEVQRAHVVGVAAVDVVDDVQEVVQAHPDRAFSDFDGHFAGYG
jgi:hypothetical protein